MRLGDLIDTLAQLPADAPIELDNGLAPTWLDSYRGYYDQLALGYGTGSATVAGVLQDAREADGQTFQGYKGGDYVMDRNTPVWVDNPGDCSGHGLVGARMDNGKAVLVIADVSDYQGY